MNIMVCIDDTDNLESPGTGDLAEGIAAGITKAHGARCSMISRHQLYIHEDIPYTSHNSSMCFHAVIREEQLDDIIRFGADFLEETSAPGSDPGLCVVNVDALRTSDALIAFGKQAKKEVLTKETAYETADKLGIHLSEHGGTGQGVIGALAGTGLRLEGNDGRFKGWMHFEGRERTMKATCLYDSPFVDAVCTREGTPIGPDTNICVGYEVKAVLLHKQATVLVAPSDDENSPSQWRTLTKRELKAY